ncbi:hypothetical protein PIIN_01337 [Serendipita indica DSM 11827]|uniref:N-acetyltransferase ESCO zinc-finger domain-containing protein n=1 Tax=Serendipita indica (strain DSM 11827) TaxID=1109443 RepID=G4T859_SERID|nr:hypothetical protein PIIN_01337 [Serendipita indica DSM 11827]
MSSKPARSYLKRARSFIDAPEIVVEPLPAIGKRPRDWTEDEGESASRHHASKRPKSLPEDTKRVGKASLTISGQTRRPLRQLVLGFSTKPAFTSCSLCKLSYTRGSPEDELLHKTHCDRVRRGGEWTREDEKEAANAGMIVIESRAIMSSGLSGRIVCVRATTGGKIGTKLSNIMSTVDTALSSPSLSKPALEVSKV